MRHDYFFSLIYSRKPRFSSSQSARSSSLFVFSLTLLRSVWLDFILLACVCLTHRFAPKKVNYRLGGGKCRQPTFPPLSDMPINEIHNEPQV